MARPVSLPTWNSGAANRVEPSAGTKVTGYALGAKPTSGNANWLHGVTSNWLAYLDEQMFAAYPATAGYVSGAGWTIDAGSLRITTTTTGAGWHVPVRFAAGHVLNLADLSWRVKPNGATNTVFGGLAVYRDGAAQLAVSKTSTTGAVAETIVGTGGTVSVGTFPYSVVAGDVAIASFTAQGGGAGTREAYWFKHTPS